jgi:hypothetical protein
VLCRICAAILYRVFAVYLPLVAVMWPRHYRDFVERHQLPSLEVELSERDDLSELGATIGLYDEAQAKDEADNFYPGLMVKPDGFVPIGQDMTGGGDPYFINLNDNPPGPLYRIYHDSVHDRDYDRDEAIVRVLDSYEELLRFLPGGQPPNKSFERTREG